MYFVAATIDEQLWLVGPYGTRDEAHEVKRQLNLVEDQVERDLRRMGRPPSAIGDIQWEVTDEPVSFEETKKAILSSL
jgi:hypothetical protein